MHNILIVLANMMALQFLGWLHGTIVLLTPFLIFGHFCLSMNYYNLIGHKLGFLRTGAKANSSNWLQNMS
jgi:hypothetical protein